MINFGQEKNIIPKCLITSVDKLKDNFNMIKFENIKAFDQFCMRKCATDINMTKLLANIDIDLKKELVYNLVLVGSHSIMKNMQEHIMKFIIQCLNLGGLKPKMHCPIHL